MKRIRRMTVTLPPRLRNVAAHEARRIAEAAVERIGDDAPARMSVEVEGRGARGHALAQAVGGRLASLGFGRR